MKITLFNGAQINLDSLDNLENKEIKNGFLRFFDGLNLGGDGNNIFDKKEIEKIKTFLIKMAGDDGKIDKKEIEKSNLKYKNIFGDYSTTNMADDLSMLNLSDSVKTGNNPVYKVKSGDTVDKIIASLGYEGEAAKKYKRALDEQLMSDGSYMNDKKWLMEGRNIRLLSNEQLRELGIDIQVTQKDTDVPSSRSNGHFYIVKSGDTLDKIVAALGYEGEEAQKYKQALDEQLTANGSYMNDRKWLMAGKKIELLSDAKIVELGITKKIPKNDSDNEKNIDSVVYTVKAGDTLDKIVAALGYEGEAAKKYKQALDEQLMSDGSYMNDKKWLMAGKKIYLLSDEKLKELGIDKSDMQEKLSEKPSLPEDKLAQKDFESNQKIPVNPDETVKIVKNSTQRILDLIKHNGQTGSIVSENILDNNINTKTYIDNFKNAYAVEPIYIKNEQTGEIHVFFDLSDSPANKQTGLSSAEYIIKDNSIKTYRYYENGKIVLDKEDLNDESHKVYSTLVQAPVEVQPEITRPIKQALPISISVDSSVYADANKREIHNINKFINALTTQKSSLMKDLDIDNDTYNKLAQLACAVAMQETDFGKGEKYYFEKGTLFVTDSLAVFNRGLDRLGIENPVNDSTAVSKGLTQIKIADWDNDPRINKLFKKHGIESAYGKGLSPEQSAIATIIVMNEIRKQVKGQTYQDAIEAANGRYYHTEAILVDGERVTQEGGYNIANIVSEEDAMMYLYNGRSSLSRGDATPAINLYTHNISRFKKLFTVNEDQALREKALKDAPEIIENSGERTPLSQDLGWGIGQVTFMPGVYTGGVSPNTETEINTLKDFLLAKNFDIDEVNKLITKMKKGDIAFFKGISKDEMSSITSEDIKLILEYSDKLNKKLKGNMSAEKKREIATQTDKAFKQEYLESHARQYYMNDVASQTVALNDETDNNVQKYPAGGYGTGAQKRCNRYLTQLRAGNVPDGGLYLYDDRVKKGLYTGFNVEEDKGINYSNATRLNILLAQNGADTANTLRTSGGCLTGAKQALIGAGVVEPDEMTTFSNAYQLATFLEKHPDRFQEVKYVQISNDVAREITSADIANLPAGYIVVYGNKSRVDVAGHAAITSGNGQLYADETDNSNWDNFVSRQSAHNGKGEHGYVRVFRLNPDYYVYNPSTNTIVER